MSIQDAQRDDRLTLESLLADPLTQLVMRSDNITVADTARAFLEAQKARAQGALTDGAPPQTAPAQCWGSPCWGGKGKFALLL
jgi:hypothetical protein